MQILPLIIPPIHAIRQNPHIMLVMHIHHIRILKRTHPRPIGHLPHRPQIHRRHRQLQRVVHQCRKLLELKYGIPRVDAQEALDA